MENTSKSTATLQLYSGNTTKGSQAKFSTTSKQVVTMSAGEWTRAELQNAKLVFTIGYYGGLVNGVDFAVVYTVPQTEKRQTVFIKSNGQYSAFANIKKIFRKSNGKYIEIEASDIEINVKYELK